ncbi:MAG: hypothetical protein ACOYL8_03105 [Patescibacteria group bacterium]
MKSSLNPSKKSESKMIKKLTASLFLFILLSSFLLTPSSSVKAGMPVVDVGNIANMIRINATDKFFTKLWKLLARAGAVSFQQILRTSLNKIAYDTANWLGSGGTGQKPLFITADWGTYLGQIGDEAAGQFIEGFASQLTSDINKDTVATGCQKINSKCLETCLNDYIYCGDAEIEDEAACSLLNQECIRSCKNAAIKCNEGEKNASATSSTAILSVKNNSGNAVPSINVCQPSSIEAGLKISLGLVEQKRPGEPNCTASKMFQTWGDEFENEYARLTDFKDPNYASKFSTLFNPTSNDLGVAMSLSSDMLSQEVTINENNKVMLQANQGWKNKTNIAKEAIGIPGDAKSKYDAASKTFGENLGRTTGDIIVDAASIFLNQIALTAFNKLMSNLGKKVDEPNNKTDVTDATKDPGVAYGEGALEQALGYIIKPSFNTQADYDILASLAACPDSSNPGPSNCVIDNQFMQGIAEKKTVAESIKGGFINGTWRLTKDTEANAYSLRNISILRKYRILPIGWEEAVNRAYSASPIKKATVNDLVSCFDSTDSYDQYSSSFDVKDQAWCRGLVDPNWVLKAPLSSCNKLGVGAQILNTEPLPSSGSGIDYTPSSLAITRAGDYCADEKTCIKEKADGGCDVYGYCNEEKRTWNFSGDSCEPINNTCNNFVNASTGKKASYLENTLDYTGCNADTAGCRQYSTFGAYATTTGTVKWDINSSAYFNKNIATCNSKDEGCTELIRVKAVRKDNLIWGTNLVMDSDFVNDVAGASSTDKTSLNDIPLSFSDNSYSNSRIAKIVDSSLDSRGALSGLGGKALLIEADGSPSANKPVSAGVSSGLTKSLLPDNFELVQGESYTYSADVYIVSGQASIYMGSGAGAISKTNNTIGSWQHLSITRIASESYNAPLFGIINSSVAGQTGKISFYVKNLKFEVTNFETEYGIYGAYKFYEKIIPPYLEKVCYEGNDGSDYTLRSDAPAVCKNFARRCNATEVGCESFTNTKTHSAVSAQVTSSDYCPGECNGYNLYISKLNYFNLPQAENIIPDSAATCNADAVGCNEFTNLDALAQGGESKEYYSELRQCIKPNASLCGSFYSWEGIDSGYQLRLYNLQKDSVTGEPKVTSDDKLECNATIFNKVLGDSNYNPDCREFYNAAGKVSYHLMSRTITCSEDCHVYRMSDNNINKTLSQGECFNQAGKPITKAWDSALNVCNECLNGGTWDSELKACTYQAIPGEGRTCSAQENGCREYNGSEGNNTRIISSYNFETGTQGWNSNCDLGLNLTTISNNKDGHSLFYTNNPTGACSSIGTAAVNPVVKARIINQVFANDNGAAQLRVGTSVTFDKSYKLRFIAKAGSGDTNVQVYFYNNNPTDPKKAYFATSTLLVKGGGEWNIYETNLDNLNHEVTENETLVITANKGFYFDDVVLTEITDRYYLIKNTSVIPDICYYDMTDNYQGADYNLGCAQYTDRADTVHNLRKFSKLCSNSSVGCEQMIATQNSSSSGKETWSDTNNNGICDKDENDCMSTTGDKAIYAIYDENKKCNQADKGCSRLGQAVASATDWSDVFKKNDPNFYDKNLCGQAELNCESWTAADGSKSYFKEPGNEACQYRASQDPSISGKAWYLIPVKRCDLDKNGAIDGTEKNTKVCNSNNDCSSKSCLIDTNDYACSFSYFKTIGLGGSNSSIPQPDKQAGLCEPTASGCSEYIDPVSRFAPNLIVNPGFEISDGFSTPEGWSGTTQKISLEKNKLYIFTTNGTGSSQTSLEFLANVRILDNKNSLDTVSKELVIPAGNKKSIIFLSLSNNLTTVKGGEKGKTIELKDSIINYQLKENIDTKTCNGAVNLDNGCVLFNERSVNGSNGLSSLVGKWDAASSTAKTSPTVCSSLINGSCNANQLIKVSPNRTCAKWLDCISYIKDEKTGERTCYAVGQCNRLGDDKECVSFEDTSSSTIRYSNDGINQNASGYYLLNQYAVGNMKEVGLNSDAHYDFEDSVPTLSCKRADGGACFYTKNIVSDFLQREPEKSPVDYPGAHGASYLKVPASYLISPQSANTWVPIIAQQQYYINFLVNTENTGLGGKLILTTKNPAGKESSMEKVYYSNNGWTRQILSFNSGLATSIRIELGASATSSDSFVYFDDINIEPVLEVGEDLNRNKQYVSRECRLYPTDSSLTCVNKNNNVLKNGLEGYCLAHDPSNKNVCLMWYPVDKVASTQLARTSAGYNGKFPLNYCTEVNGNFDLVEYRKPYLLIWDRLWEGDHKFPYTAGWDESRNSKCDPGYHVYVTNYTYDGKITSWNADHNLSYSWCIPITSSNAPLIRFDNNKVDDTLTVNIGHGDRTIEQSGTAGWYRYSGSSPRFNLNDNPVRVLDYNLYPTKEDDFKLISGNDPDSVYRLTCNNFVQLVDNNGDNQAWANRVSKNSKYLTTTTPFFKSSISPGHDIVGYGQNRQDTPFGAALWPDSFNLLNSVTAVNLRNQFSTKNKETVLAGRPFGCSNYKSLDSGEKGMGCNNIGQCSLDYNVYCIREVNGNGGYVASKTCAEAGLGTCVPIWNGSYSPVSNATANDYLVDYLGREKFNGSGKQQDDYNSLLSNLFLKSFNSYSFSKDNEAYVPGGLSISPSASLTDCGLTRNNENSFCYVIPKIGNVIFSGVKYDNKSNFIAKVSQKGIYSLSFTTSVNAEQLPLKQIHLDWGDGAEQLITGQDSHEEVGNPHVFYHYYSSVGDKQINIKVRDNWDKESSQ